MFRRTLLPVCVAALFTLAGLSACTTEGESDSVSASISAGRYSGTYTIPWYEDDATLYKLLDIEDLKSDGSAEGKLYWMRTADTVLICESQFKWSQRGNQFVSAQGRQRCKDPDFLSMGFDDWYEDDGETLSPVRNVTADAFEMEGSDINDAKFWVKMQK